MKTYISIICPVYNEKRYIARCIESVLASDWPHDDMELLLVDGGSTDRTREIIAGYMSAHPLIRLIDNPQKIVPTGLNKAIAEARGEYIVRIDAHAEYDPRYFTVLVNRCRELDADNVGCVWITEVLNKTPKSLAIKEVLSNRFGVGGAIFRIGTDEVIEADTVPFGCWPRRVFETYGMFDPRLVRNQDIEFNKRIRRGGGRIYLIPEALCTYYARETYRAIARNNYQNGRWNILTVWLTGTAGSLSVRHFIPLIFLLSLIFPPIFALLWPPLAWVSAASLAAYLLSLTAISTRLAIRNGLNFFYLLWAFITLHFSYGTGSLAGILQLPFTRRK